MFKHLFSPIQIRGVTLPNRVVMPAVGSHMPDENNFITPILIGYHAARAAGGCGLNTLECCSVNWETTPPKHASIAADKFLPGHKALTKAIHDAGGKCAVQLWLTGPAAGMDPTCPIYLPDGYRPDDASTFLIPGAKTEADGTVSPVTAEKLAELIGDFGKAAKRAVEAGYDVVEFHCGHNYLPHMMLSKGFNHRTDEYGGSLENRMRFPLACIRSIRENIPADMPLFMRISALDEPELDNGKGGNTLEENIVFCKAAKEAGVDVVNVSRGNFTTMLGTCFEVPPVDFPNGFNVDNAARIRRETGLITMAVGRINTPELAEDILASGKADLICMGRAQIADPDFCNKAKAGQCSAIKYCIGCLQGCQDYFMDPTKAHISCLRNPAVGREQELALTKTATPKRVLIAGGGIASLEAADALRQRGHTPILCEAGDHLGGQFLLAGVAPRKGDFVYAAKMAAQNVMDLGLDVRLHTPVTPALIEELQPDAVIVAIGSKPILPRIPGADRPNILESHQVMGGAAVKPGKAVVIGGGLVGIEVAEHLAHQGCTVTAVEMKSAILGELGTSRLICTQGALAHAGIQVLLNTTCKEIGEGSVTVESDGTVQTLEADIVVMAIGSKPVPSGDLQAACEKGNIPCYVVGDALAAPRLAMDAIHEALAAVRSI